MDAVVRIGVRGVAAVGIVALALLSPSTAFGQFRSPDRAMRQTALSGASDSMLPRVCSPSSGVAYAVWGDFAEGFAFSPDVWFAKTTNGGTTWTAPARINVGNPPGMGFVEPRQIRIACDASNNVVVAWSQEVGGEYEIYANVSRDAGTSWLARPVRLSASAALGTNSSHHPALCAPGDGSFWAAWVYGNLVKVRLSNDGGSTWGTIWTVNTLTAPANEDDVDPGSVIDLSCLSGKAQVAWRTPTQIWANATTDSGATWRGMTRFDLDSNADGDPSLAVEPGGHVYLTWADAAAVSGDIDLVVSQDAGATWGVVQRVDHAGAGVSSTDPRVAGSSTGKVVVVWRDARGGAMDVWATSSNNFGAVGSWATSDTRLDTGGTAAGAGAPGVRSCGESVGVTWLDDRNGGVDPYFDGSSDGGVTWKGERRLDAGVAAGTESRLVRAACDGATGSWFALWDDDRGTVATSGFMDIYSDRSTDFGQTWKATDVRVDTATAQTIPSAYGPSLTADGSGNVYAVWADERAGNPDVYFSRSTNRGDTWSSPEVRLNSGAAGSGYAFLPQACTDGANNVYVAWVDLGPGRRVWFRRSSDKGATWTSAPVTLDHTASPVTARDLFDMTCDGSGHVYVVWSDNRNDASDAGVMDVFFNGSNDGGATWLANEKRLNTDNAPGTGEATYARIASDASGRVHVAWLGRTTLDGTTPAKVIVNSSADYGVGWKGPITVSHSTQWAESCAVAADGQGRAFVAWEDVRNGGLDIFVNRSLNAGTSWEATDTRVDLGDAAGSHASYRPLIAADTARVLVAWVDDRDGTREVFANASSDGGATWSSSAVRVDSGDAPGTHMAEFHPFWGLALRGPKARITLLDDRSGRYDVMVNYSENGGTVWGQTAIRVEAGDAPGASDAAFAAIAVAPDGWTYVGWLDHRGGDHVLRSNAAACVAAPGEPTVVRFSDKVTLNWTSPIDSGGTCTLVYDTLRSVTPSSFAGAVCQESNGTDTTTPTTEVPSSGGYYYLVRAENGAGSGPLGQGKNGPVRTGPSCP